MHLIKLASWLTAAILWNSQTWAVSCETVELYEENAMESLLGMDEFSQQSILPVECIEASMELFEKWTKTLKKSSKPFAYCNGANEEVLKKKAPLCKTETLKSNIQKIFVNTMDCLDIPARALFPIINVESGFFPNAVAPRGDDAGIGQVTPIAVQDANSRWSWIANYLASSPKKSCAALASHLTTLQMNESPSEHMCQLTHPEFNPQRNLLYAGFIYLINTKYFNDFFSENDLQRRIEVLTAQRLPPELKNQTIHVLSLLAYNKGFPWIRERFLAYIENQEQQSGLDIEQLNQLASEMSEISKKINKSSNHAQFAATSGLRDVLRQKKMKYHATLSRRGNTKYTFKTVQLDYHNFSKGSMMHFLRKMDSSKYIELAIARNQSIEDKLGMGTCGDFNFDRQSAVLEFMVW